jgi:hypothetical protein
LSDHMSIHMKSESSVVAHWHSTFSIPMDTDGKLNRRLQPTKFPKTPI